MGESSVMKHLIVAGCLALMTFPALAGPVADWVAPLALADPPDTPEDFTDGGVLFLLHDRQTRLTDEGYEARPPGT